MHYVRAMRRWKMTQQKWSLLVVGIVFAVAGFAGAWMHLRLDGVGEWRPFAGLVPGVVQEVPAASTPAAFAVEAGGGRVLAPDDGPVSGAAVHFFRPGSETSDFTAHTDGNGRFSTPADAKPGEYWRVKPEKEGYFGAEILWEAGTPPPVLRLLPAAGLHVEVVDAQGRPAAGAHVRIAGMDVPSSAEWTTGADGRVFAGGLPPGVLTITAVLDRQVAEMEGIELEPGQTAHAHLYLEEGIVVKGLVRDDRDDRPIAGALFSIAREEPSLLTRTASTGEDGQFVIGPLPQGNYRFSLSAAGYVPLAARRFWVGKTTGLALFELTRGIVITGRVLDAAGRPLSGVRVDAWGMDASGNWIAPVALSAPGLIPAGQLGVTSRNFELGRTAGGSAVTDEKGEYRLAGVSPGYIWISASHEDFVPGGRLLGEVAEDHEAPDIRLEAGREVTLVVRDERDFAVSGALVRLEGAFGMEEGRTFITDDPSGEVHLSGVGRGDVVSLFHPDFPVHVERITGERLQRVRMERGRETFSLRLRDARRLPVAGAQVELVAVSRPERRVLASDEHGMVRFEGVARGTYDVMVTHPQYAAWKKKGIEPGEYDWILPYGGGFSAFVRDRQTLEGLSARITLFSPDGERVVQDAVRGEAVFSALPSGLWRVRVDAEGYVPFWGEVAVQDAENLLENNGAPQLWELERAGSVSGVVRDAAGFVARGAVVTAGSEFRITDRNGRFSIQGLSPGEVVVTAWHPRLGMGSERVHVLADLEAPEVIVDLVPGPSGGRPGRLGVRLEKDPANSVVRVHSVQPGSPADKAGLKAGDVVWSVDGLSCALPLSFLETRLQKSAGTVTCWRVGPFEELAVPVFLRFE